MEGPKGKSPYILLGPCQCCLRFFRFNGHTSRELISGFRTCSGLSGLKAHAGQPVRGLSRRTLRLRYPPPPLPPYILLHLIIVLLSFHCSYLFSPSDRILPRT